MFLFEIRNFWIKGGFGNELGFVLFKMMGILLLMHIELWYHHYNPNEYLIEKIGKEISSRILEHLNKLRDYPNYEELLKVN